MGRTVGNIIVLISLACAALVHAELELRLVDLDGNLIKQAGVGVPFVLEVLVSDLGHVMQQPAVKGIEQLPSPQGTGMNAMIVNGKSTIKHTYQYQVDQPGTYVLGPAELQQGSTHLKSNVVKLIVGQEQVTQHANQQKEQRKAFLQLLTDQDHLVVGQVGSYRIRFFYLGDVALKSIGAPDLAHLNLGSATGPTKGTQSVDGVDYNYAEWRYPIAPKQTGDVLIPAHFAEFEVPRTRNNLFGGFFSFSQNALARSYSNSLKIMVDPLPEHTEPVNGVGNFTRFSAKIQPESAKVGEGMVLALTIEGEGAQNVTALPVNLPEEFKWYDSKNYLADQDPSAAPARVFEFILQGLKVGDWEIPVQRFVYYDLKTKRYKTLKTSPLAVSIRPGNVAITVPQSVEDQQDIDNAETERDPLRMQHKAALIGE